MFVRVKPVVQNGQRYEYLQIVRSERDGARVRQQLVASLGRRDLLVATGKLDQLLQALARFSTRLKVVEAAQDGRFVARDAKTWGPALVFGRLWQRQGLPEILDRLAEDRRFGFAPERVAFALALQRLCAPGSDLQGAAWAQTVEAPGFDDLALHHFYRTLPWLAAVRHELERDLFFQGRDLFSAELDLVFVDTTSVYLHRDAAGPLVRHGYSRDRRPELPQLVLCVAVDGQGWPVAFDILPGNTADTEALRLTIARFRQRFRIRRAVVVADRGMLGQATITELHDHPSAPFDYILGCPLRRERAVANEVLARPGRYQSVADNLEVKEVRLGARRYVVCRNPIEAKQDAADREALLAKLRQTLEHDGPKAVVGNRGYARFLTIAKDSVRLNEAAIAREARLDGKFVLTTSTKLPAAEVALAYKSLWRVERAFRALKSTLDVRPVFHQRDDSVIGHIVGCFLALRLEVDLQHRLDAKGLAAPWPDLMRDLARLQAVIVDLDGTRYRLRTDCQGHAAKAFQAAGVAVPTEVTPLGPVPDQETPAASAADPLPV
ncbi:MAG TPA: IS1634 family transposase [Geminicoccaceae bacterium]|nr:IS1634 family transposase [Geminicoccaceae bacterium]